MSEPAPERTIESRRLYEGRIVNLRVDTVELAGGARATREVVEHGDVVAIVPLLEDGRVLMVRQYRLAVEAALLEVPAGGVEAGESAEGAAQRELGEECGRRAGRLERLGGFYVSPGFTNEFVHVFLASELESAPTRPEADEQLELVTLPLAEALDLVAAREVRDAKSIIGLLWVWAKVHAFTIEPS